MGEEKGLRALIDSKNKNISGLRWSYKAMDAVGEPITAEKLDAALKKIPDMPPEKYFVIVSNAEYERIKADPKHPYHWMTKDRE